MPDAYRLCAEALVEIFNRAIGENKLTEAFTQELYEEFDVWSNGDDSLPFITWSANKINEGLSLNRSFLFFNKWFPKIHTGICCLNLHIFKQFLYLRYYWPRNREMI